jgi:hypothetical protein
MSNIITLGPVERTVPQWFTWGLRETDPNLIVYFNEHKDRWIVDRCTRDGEMRSSLHEHNNNCPRTNVLVVEEDEGGYMPLCDAVLDQIRGMDSWNHRNYGNLHAHNVEKSAVEKAKRDKAIKNLYSDAAVDNKRQLNEAYTLIQRHGTGRYTHK